MIPALGRLPHDPAQIAALPQFATHRMGALVAPPSMDRSHIDYRPKGYDNDTRPVCTIVGLAECARAAAALQGFDIAITTADVDTAYAAAGGGADGLVEADVLTWQVQHGFRVAARQDALVAGCMTIRPDDLNAIRQACVWTGAVYLGVDLALADQAALDVPDSVWDAGGDVSPWGGHCLLLWDYAGVRDTDTVRLVTWGELRRATWAWIRSRMVEAHAVQFRQISGADPDFDLAAARMRGLGVAGNL